MSRHAECITVLHHIYSRANVDITQTYSLVSWLTQEINLCVCVCLCVHLCYLLLLNSHVKQRCVSCFCSLILKTTTTPKARGQNLQNKVYRPHIWIFLKKQTITSLSVTSSSSHFEVMKLKLRFLFSAYFSPPAWSFWSTFLHLEWNHLLHFLRNHLKTIPRIEVTFYFKDGDSLTKTKSIPGFVVQI